MKQVGKKKLAFLSAEKKNINKKFFIRNLEKGPGKPFIYLFLCRKHRRENNQT